MYRSIVVAVDGSELGHRALVAATGMAAAFKSRLTVVHALLRGVGHDNLHPIIDRLKFDEAQRKSLVQLMVPPMVGSGVAGGEAPVVVVPEDALTMIGQRVLAEAAVVAAASVIDVRQVLSSDHPAAAIAAAAAEAGADLIVMGSRGLGRLKGFLLGSVSQQVVHDSACPCLIVK
ncbi:MAG: universal stress protein [Rhodospirillaceae bacterium]|nr:universal stress protein [Rhodospirillaceae bacterium]